jgi:hypothetical protein
VRHNLVLPETLLTEEELVIELAARVRKRGDHQRVAGELGVSQPALRNRRPRRTVALRRLPRS